jgi:multiple sugar transport system substrate-binding protein
MRVRAVLLAAALTLPSPRAWAADLVVWWEKGFYPQEDEAVEEVISAFQAKTGSKLELSFLAPEGVRAKARAAVEAGRPPDFLFSLNVQGPIYEWAYDDRLVDLTDAVEPFRHLFAPDSLELATLFNASTGRRGLYALPMGRATHHIYVWRSLLEQAGLKLEDIPKEWGAFWSFWCDTVQPAVRISTGRDDVWGIGLPMSLADDTHIEFWQFQLAYEADWATAEGRLRVDDPAVRAGLIEALDTYTAIWRKGCTPPDSVEWTDSGNNKAFLAQTVVMTPNSTLSIPNALRVSRPDDFRENMVTIEWPAGAYGQPLRIDGVRYRAVVLKGGGHEAAAKEFVRFLVGEGWLAHWLNFAGERFLPPMPALMEQPFWLDPNDPHRLQAVMQVLMQPSAIDPFMLSHGVKARAYRQLRDEGGWAKVVHRVATDGVSPEQAIDEAIARIKQILGE